MTVNLTSTNLLNPALDRPAISEEDELEKTKLLEETKHLYLVEETKYPCPVESKTQEVSKNIWKDMQSISPSLTSTPYSLKSQNFVAEFNPDNNQQSKEKVLSKRQSETVFVV